jgi:hypothetical protein
MPIFEGFFRDLAVFAQGKVLGSFLLVRMPESSAKYFLLALNLP